MKKAFIVIPGLCWIKAPIVLVGAALAAGAVLGYKGVELIYKKIRGDDKQA